ncbi:MAG: Gfo/Idh/MocA family oxidoreductase [Candidatus Omnitrophica bacterium]|nr:Gfo/Idh/MocA family oxidoreductase [Candidatus Omnitrophota bacterium]
MIKILLLGIGRWGANHLRVLHSLPVELYVSDVQRAQLEKAHQLGIPEDRLSIEPMALADRVEAAVIATPAQAHFDLARDLMEAGKDVFVEKPITLVSEQARQLALLAERRQRILQVGHIFRFDPASLWLREAIRQSHFGHVRMLRGNFSGFKRPRNDSGVAFADAIHFIDLFNFLLDTIPRRVSAVMQDFLGRGLDDATVISLEYPHDQGNTWAMIETNYFEPGKSREVVVIGSDLSAVCDYNVAQYKIRTFQNRHLRSGDHFQAQEGVVRQIECPPEEPLLAELRAFLQSVRTREAPCADGWDGYESVHILEAAMESARRGATIEIRK